MRPCTLLIVLAAALPTLASADELFDPVIERARGEATFAVEEVLTVTASQDGVSRTSDPVEIHVERTPDGRGRIDLRGFTVFIDQDDLSVVHDSNEDAYVPVAHAGRPIVAMRRLFTDVPSIWSVLAFSPPNDDGLLVDLLPAARGLRATAVATDEAIDHYSLESEHASGRFDHTVPGGLVVEVTGGAWVPAGARLRWDVVVTPGSPRGTDFQPDGRRALDSIAALVRPTRPPVSGEPARSLALPLASGGSFELAEQRGKVVILDFWASWGGPCRKALPRLDRLATEMQEAGLPVTVLTINTSEQERDPGRRTAFVLAQREAIGFSLPVGIDIDGAAARAWGDNALPTTIIIGPDGVLSSIHKGAGPDYEQMLEEEVRGLLQQDDAP